MVKSLMSLKFASDFHGKSVLQMAIEANCTEAVKLLLQHGADPKHVDFGDDEEPPIMLAIMAENFEVLKLLVESGADLDDGDSFMLPIHCAARRGTCIFCHNS